MQLERLRTDGRIVLESIDTSSKVEVSSWKELANGNVKYTADGVIHESGHAVGLQHQSQYSGTTKTAEYRQALEALEAA